MEPITILTAAGVLAAFLGTAVVSRPHLRKEIYTDYGLGTFTIKLKNTGKGGATILDMELKAYGVSSDEYDVNEFVNKMAPPITMVGNPGIEFNIYDKGDVVASGDELIVFEAKIPKDDNELDTTFACLKNNLLLRGRYKSILGETFKIKE